MIRKVFIVLIVLVLLGMVMPTSFLGLSGLIPVRRDGVWTFAIVSLVKDFVRGFHVWREEHTTKAGRMFYWVLVIPALILNLVRLALAPPLALFSFLMVGVIRVWVWTLPLRTRLFGPKPYKASIVDIKMGDIWSVWSSWKPEDLYTDPVDGESSTVFHSIALTPPEVPSDEEDQQAQEEGADDQKEGGPPKTEQGEPKRCSTPKPRKRQGMALAAELANPFRSNVKRADD